MYIVCRGIKIPPISKTPPPPPTFKVKVSSDLKFYS